MNFLKKLFKKKEEELAFSKLSSWLVQNIEFTLANEVQKFKGSLVQLDTAIRNLSDFEIHKLDIPPKAKNQIQGNKKSYIQALKAFHNKTEPPSAFDSESLDEYDTELKDRLKAFNQKTSRNYYILKSVVGKELEAVLVSLRRVDNARKKIKATTEKQNLRSIEAIHGHIKGINDTIVSNMESKVKLKGYKDTQARLLKEEAQLTSNIKRIENGEEFHDFNRLKLKRDKLHSKQSKLQNDLISKILPLENVLRKFQKTEKSKPAKALLSDKDQFILKHKDKAKTLLKALEDSIDKGKVSAKSKEKAMKQIKSLRKAIDPYPSKVKELKRELQAVDKSLSKNKFEEKMRHHVTALSKVSTELGKTNQLIGETSQRIFYKSKNILKS